MKIAIIGAGNVGKALGQGWHRRGHDVTYGVRNPADPKHTGLSAVAANAEAARDAEVVVIALPWGETETAVGLLGAALDGKVVVDATNPIAADFSGPAFGQDDSAGERVQRLVPRARVVKAFNTTGAGNMADPGYAAGAATMLVAGDDAAAVDTVRGLAAELGFDALAAGPLKLARQLEQLAWLWIHLAYKQGLGTEIAFRLMKR
jgi:hypothetical protein